MDILFDFLIELFFEIFGEGFISLCSAFVPNKIISQKGQKMIGVVCLIVSMMLLVGLLVGIIILVETSGQSFWGWLLVSLSVIYVISGIVLKIVSHIK